MLAVVECEVGSVEKKERQRFSGTRCGLYIYIQRCLGAQCWCFQSLPRWEVGRGSVWHLHPRANATTPFQGPRQGYASSCFQMIEAVPLVGWTPLPRHASPSSTHADYVPVLSPPGHRQRHRAGGTSSGIAARPRTSKGGTSDKRPCARPYALPRSLAPSLPTNTAAEVGDSATSDAAGSRQLNSAGRRAGRQDRNSVLTAQGKARTEAQREGQTSVGLDTRSRALIPFAKARSGGCGLSFYAYENDKYA
ncbi:hypothetical protein BCV69DRAFT_117699 [Microstroma glucosiphilum]|uniref:Uncharacterized protein n=1 Tax=Pseudomicrostroma glucosiphilum TaxID=1684307 RepID=A0A316UJJ8_9BASI|nr:hypothetical protein BCV69DRAFT_117699 [Pseudomicrostroma glucosiphilum]PWN23385.1 hypothetical protein BCV69DRAFT_117699 [Pseudomicrostroma glucosiphilum]